MTEERPSGPGDTGRVQDDNDDSGVGRRRLLSLAAQRRRKDEEERRRREKLAAEPVVDPGPPDPMIAALEALSGIDADEDGEGDDEPEGATDEDPEPRQERSPAAAAPQPPPTAESDEAEPTESDGADGAGADGARIAAASGNGTQPERLIRTVVRRSEPDRPRPTRPSRPVYTLQEVHEHTGIPYAKLALYAASHADQIPSVGERRSPAYLRKGMEAFCRLHALKEPGWEMPDLGPEPGWDDERGLAVRLEALETAQRSTADQLRGIVRTLRKPWNGQATWE